MVSFPCYGFCVFVCNGFGTVVIVELDCMCLSINILNVQFNIRHRQGKQVNIFKISRSPKDNLKFNSCSLEVINRTCCFNLNSALMKCIFAKVLCMTHKPVTVVIN